MTPGQAPLDRPLAFQQPVHRRIERVFVDRAQPQLPGQAVAQRVVAQTARGGQLGARGEDAGHDHGHHQGAPARGLGGDQALEPEAAQAGEHGRDMAVGAGAGDGEGVLGCDEGLVLEHAAQGLDLGGGPFGEVGDGALLDLSALAPAFAQEDGGG